MNHPPGTIIFFKGFRFDTPGTSTRPAAKDKFFVVLCRMANAMVVANLPTSVDRIPDSVKQVHGCNRYSKGDWTAYVFEALRPVTTCDWAFPLRTYMYGFGVGMYSVEALALGYPREGHDFVLKGRLTELEFSALVDCLKRSVDIKRGMRVALDGALYGDDIEPTIASDHLESYGSDPAPAM